MARERLPRTTPEQRVKMLMAFVLTPFKAMDEADRITWWSRLSALQSQRGDVSRPLDYLLALEETHIWLHRHITELAHERPVVLHVPKIVWLLEPPIRRRAGSRRSPPITRTANAPRFERQHMVPTLMLGLVDDLNAIGADRLRACPLVKDGQACDRIFLARRRQVFCTPQHAQAAAWIRYEPTRKERGR
jgi:hypothetical protein